jgi:DNA-binding transcriptional ArsR family regulator
MMEAELIPLVATRFRALSDPRRLTLLSALQEKERCVGELALLTGRPQPNVSQHLASLARAGLVEGRREGNRVFYRIADPFVVRICDAVCESLIAHARQEQQRQARVAAAHRRRRGGEKR